MFIVAACFTSGCTKDMKDDIDALKGDVAGLKDAVEFLRGSTGPELS